MSTATLPADVRTTLAAAALEPWASLRIVADACEEAGDPARAAGYRWLAGLRKFPAGDRGLWWWMPPRVPGSGPGEPIDPELPGSASARLPYMMGLKVRDRCRPVIGRHAGEFDSIADAWDAAAAAAGEWLAEPEDQREIPF
jgi:hypothetical protein